MTAFKLLVLSAALLTVGSPVFAQAEDLSALSPLDRGQAIAERSDKSDAGFGSSSVELTMTIEDPRGRTSKRELQFDTLEKSEAGLGDRTLTRFFSPPNVEGTALLSHAKILESDDQWLYLPALRRVKRISSANRSGPFVGSEFAFEDLTGGELGKYEYKYLETVVEDGMEMDKLECTPLYERSGYTKLYCYYDTKVFQSRKIEFHDRGGNLFKTLVLDEYREYEGGIWRSHRQVMTNHLTKKSTVLELSNFEFGVDLNKRDFEAAALDRL